MTADRFSFINTFNMGYEGFSKPLALQRMHPIYGNKGEFVALFGLIIMLSIVKKSRKNHEDSLRKVTKATNRYAELALDANSRQPSKWTL